MRKASSKKLKVPKGYRVYETLVGTWRWSKGIFGTPSWTDGENLENKEAAIRDAIRDAAASKALPASVTN